MKVRIQNQEVRKRGMFGGILDPIQSLLYKYTLEGLKKAFDIKPYSYGEKSTSLLLRGLS